MAGPAPVTFDGCQFHDQNIEESVGENWSETASQPSQSCCPFVFKSKLKLGPGVVKVALVCATPAMHVIDSSVQDLTIENQALTASLSERVCRVTAL